jgi:CheY-like chemotaxis protein
MIFGEFEQLDHGAAAGQTGTGLGLAIVRRLARLMGGEVQAESRLGEGATFASRCSRAAADAPDARILHWPGQHILLVSPAPFAVRFLAETIRTTGAAVRSPARPRPRGQSLAGAPGHGGADRSCAWRCAGKGVGRGRCGARHLQLPHPAIASCPPAVRIAAGGGFSGFLIKPVRTRSLYERLGNGLQPGPSVAGEPAALAATLMHQPGAGLTVLVAEDNEINALLATRTLERFGCTAIWARWARSLEAGRGQLCRHRAALGARAARCTHAQDDGARLCPCRACAGATVRPRRHAAAGGCHGQCLRHGPGCRLRRRMDDCLAKPLEREALLRWLERLSQRRPAV